MSDLLTPRRIVLDGGNRVLRSQNIAVDPKAAILGVVLRRPTTTNGLRWSVGSSIRVTIALLVDGEEYHCIGVTTGGVRRGRNNEERDTYRLIYNLGSVITDQGPLRPGQRGNTVQAYVKIERLSGTIETDLLSAVATPLDPPLEDTHRSVAYVAVASAYEEDGDGAVTFSLTCNGSNSAVFAAGTLYDNPTASSATFNCTAMTTTTTPTILDNCFSGSSSFYRAIGSESGSLSCTYNFTACSVYAQGCIAMSFDGVDQTTPVADFGRSANAVGVTSPTQALTVASDDMVADVLESDFFPSTSWAVQECGQTERLDGVGDAGGYNLFMAASTRPGSSGGTVTWDISSGCSQWCNGSMHHAIGFAAVAAGGGRTTKNTHFTCRGEDRGMALWMH